MSVIASRIHAYNRQRGRCFYCRSLLWEKKLEPEKSASNRILRFDPQAPDSWANQSLHDAVCTAEHLVPKANGGTDSPSNIVAACRYCNSRRGNLSKRVWNTQLRRSLPTIRAGTEKRMPNFQNGFDKVPWAVQWRYLFFVETDHLDVSLWLMEQGECWIRHCRDEALLFPHASLATCEGREQWQSGPPERLAGTRVLLADNGQARSFKARFRPYIV